MSGNLKNINDVIADGATVHIPAVSKTAAYSVVVGDYGNLFLLSGGTFTVTLPAVSTVDNGWCVGFKYAGTMGTDIITIDGNGAETIDGVASVDLYASNETLWVVMDGGQWRILHHSKGFIGCSVHRNGVGQSILNGTFTKVEFTHADYDIGAKFDGATNYRWTPGVLGFCSIKASVGLGTSVTDHINQEIQIRKNGGVEAQAIIPTGGTFNDQTVEISKDFVVGATTDYFEIWYAQTSGVTKTYSGGKQHTYACFKMVKV